LRAIGLPNSSAISMTQDLETSAQCRLAASFAPLIEGDLSLNECLADMRG
jgi:hypothetical protein